MWELCIWIYSQRLVLSFHLVHFHIDLDDLN